MDVSVDLHSHSGASGGVGDISLKQVTETMALKGIGIFGTGDCLHEGWHAALKQALVQEGKSGLFKLTGTKSKARFLLQTEIIFTATVTGGGRKTVHTLLLFPSFKAARQACTLFDRWQVKRTIGRPFVTCTDQNQVAERVFALRQIDAGIEVIPAHVLTPQGIYGSNRPITWLADFFGDAADSIRIVETGLSADPQVLGLIPELDTRTLISNSDGHSGALNRVGREYTTLKLNQLSYDEVISAMRERRIVRTAEFTPAEGRYFLTGHRSGKGGHAKNAFCYFSPDRVPAYNRCPICGKQLTVGVLQRALELSTLQGEVRCLEEVLPRQEFLHMIPLVEVIAAGLGLKSCNGKKVVGIYHRLVKAAEGETTFWNLSDSEVKSVLIKADAESLTETVNLVRTGQYSFAPLGFDGEYGTLSLGAPCQWFGHEVVQGGPSAASAPLF